MTRLEPHVELQAAVPSWLHGASVPAHWMPTTLRYVVTEMFAGEAITAEDIEAQGDFPVFGGNGLRGFTSSYTHEGQCILIGRQGALCGNVHLVGGRFWASEHAIVTRARRDIDVRWLYYLMRVMNLGQYSLTAAQPGIGVAQIAKVGLHVPPVAEQRAIADYLDRETAQIDALIGKQERLIRTLRERHFTRLSSLVDQPDNRVPLRRHLRSIRQGWSPNCEPEAADGVDDWGVLKTGAVNGGAFSPWQNKRLPSTEVPRPELAVRRGEVVVSRASSREYVGSAAVVLGHYPRLMLSDLTYGLEVSNRSLDPEYLALALASRRSRWHIESAAKGTSPSMQKLSQRDVGDLLLSIPSLNQQRELVQVIHQQERSSSAIVAKAEQFIALARERRAALITAAVTGQIDVRSAS